MNEVRTTYLAAAQVVPAIIDAAAEHWDEPSSLPGWKVGGLTGHTARGVATVVRYLAQPTPPRGPERDAVDYFDSFDLRAPDFAAAVVARGEEEAAVGPVALRESVDEWIQNLTEVLPGLPLDHRVAVLDAFSILVDEYLLTRIVELVVHHADLAVTLDLPEMPAGARAMAIDVLVAISRRKHGDRAVIEALSRSERAKAITVF